MRRADDCRRMLTDYCSLNADWGRVGGEDSMFNPSTVQGCADSGVCCSSLQQANFPDNFDYGDIIGAPQLQFLLPGWSTPMHQI